MIVRDFDLLRVGSIPCETNAPLVIDANAVLTGTAAFQRLQSVARRQAEEGEFNRRIDQLEFDESAALHIRWKSAGANAAPEFFSLRIGKVPDHAVTSMTPFVYSSNR